MSSKPCNSLSKDFVWQMLQEAQRAGWQELRIPITRDMNLDELERNLIENGLAISGIRLFCRDSDEGIWHLKVQRSHD